MPCSTAPVEHLDLSRPLTIPFAAKLREEYSGGILFNREAHAHYMFDRPAYALVEQLIGAVHTGRQLLDVLTPTMTTNDAEETLAALVAQGVVAPAAGCRQPSIQHFPARDLSLGYLQNPIIVEVEVTYGCFRACRHCAYESSPEARIPGELTAEQWGVVFRKLTDAGVLIVQLTGGGPLFRPDSFEIVETADHAGLSVYVRSDTAALSELNIQRLRALRGLWHVGTSIDGADAAMHDWMRGRGAFDIL